MLTDREKWDTKALEDRAISLLDKLGSLFDYIDHLTQQKNELMDAAIPDEIKEKIKGIEDEYDLQLRNAQDEIIDLQERIKAAVLYYGESIQGGTVKAIHVKGRESWDTKALDGYAIAHPEILSLKTVGDPSIRFKKL